jgi:hypothetical protein
LTGTGYRLLGDAWLAETGRRRAIEERRVARDDLRTSSLSRREAKGIEHGLGRCA